MKKALSILLAAVLILSLTACTATGETVEDPNVPSENTMGALEQETPDNGDEDEPPSGGAPTAPENGAGSDGEEETGGILVAYFSWADNAVLEDDVDAVTSPSVIPPGNVQQLAGWVQEETGGDLFSIRVTELYPSDWDECLARANEERGDNARPELVENVDNLDDYDVVFLGYPNWWYGVPMALLTFLEQNDLSGKQVYLFCSHGTGGLANSVELITEAAPDALISDNIFDCYEEDASSSQAGIQDWVAQLGYTQATAEGQSDISRQISVRFGENVVIYELNDSAAASALCDQLPLTVEVEDYSTNEKIFYPPQELDTTDCPLAAGGSGTLAYYAPWGDVVMFYGDYSQNPSLFELGQVISGGELVGGMSGTVTVDTVA